MSSQFHIYHHFDQQNITYSSLLNNYMKVEPFMIYCAVLKVNWVRIFCTLEITEPSLIEVKKKEETTTFNAYC